MLVPWNFSDLEIIGYADVLKASMLPSVVPPVFRLKADIERVLVPPYSFKAGYVWNATEVPESELFQLAERHEVTLFDAAFPALSHYELWVDQSFQWHYEPLDRVKESLRQIADKATKGAEEALRTRDFQQAERLSGIAISADDRRVEPLAIKAAIRRLRGDNAGERLMASLAAPVLGDVSFNSVVDRYCDVQRRPPLRAAASNSCGPMSDMAAMRQTASPC